MERRCWDDTPPRTPLSSADDADADEERRVLPVVAVAEVAVLGLDASAVRDEDETRSPATSKRRSCGSRGVVKTTRRSRSRMRRLRDERAMMATSPSGTAPPGPDDDEDDDDEEEDACAKDGTGNEEGGADGARPSHDSRAKSMTLPPVSLGPKRSMKNDGVRRAPPTGGTTKVPAAAPRRRPCQADASAACQHATRLVHSAMQSSSALRSLRTARGLFASASAGFAETPAVAAPDEPAPLVLALLPLEPAMACCRMALGLEASEPLPVPVPEALLLCLLRLSLIHI